MMMDDVSMSQIEALPDQWFSFFSVLFLTEGTLEVKLPTYGQMQQQFWKQSEKRKSQRRESR